MALKKEKSGEDDVYIVVFNSDGSIGSVTITEKRYAANMARQLRSGNRKVRQIADRDEYLALFEKEAMERRRNMRLFDEFLSDNKVGG